MGRKRKYKDLDQLKEANKEKARRFYLANKSKVDKNAKIHYWQKRLLTCTNGQKDKIEEKLRKLTEISEIVQNDQQQQTT